jgi:hypothetical protein
LWPISAIGLATQHDIQTAALYQQAVIQPLIVDVDRSASTHMRQLPVMRLLYITRGARPGFRLSRTRSIVLFFMSSHQI